MVEGGVREGSWWREGSGGHGGGVGRGDAIRGTECTAECEKNRGHKPGSRGSRKENDREVNKI